ncbi:Aldo/keto reductase [Penicillium roqueforti FM164]|uniref:Aldo/keto reductase n=1 Tax=Penicillium roqueforti (strain FM164) TaxID=1365484 RepID=W6QSG4_PENRF|nr:Aldo/keto reductase [Penicillium roqueforti FM164]
MSLGKKVTLNTGHQIPQLGFGTWQSAPGLVGEAVYEALKAGYRHLVCTSTRTSVRSPRASSVLIKMFPV